MQPVRAIQCDRNGSDLAAQRASIMGDLFSYAEVDWRPELPVITSAFLPVSAPVAASALPAPVRCAPVLNIPCDNHTPANTSTRCQRNTATATGTTL
jgi:hypothetical protein